MNMDGHGLRRKITPQNCRWLAVLAASVLAVAGCHQQPTRSTYSRTVTFKTAEPAPNAFDGWDLVWKGPKRDPDIDLEYVVLQPDGKEYGKQEFAAYPGKSESIQSSFSAGFAGGDPKVFYNQTIRFRFRVKQGDLSFAPADTASFTFRFFKRDANGDLEWRKPFKTIQAVPEK